MLSGECQLGPHHVVHAAQLLPMQAEPLAHAALDVIAAHRPLGHLLADHQPYAGMVKPVGADIHLEERIAALLPQTKNG
ncbi:hypothetical protein AWB61_01180 [Chromobacterium sp. F49]|nr:hypothetical protein Cv017_18745 [Chromobacterium subtsugae]KZE86721.1 hypothetical protein AWB61_01180 [Chromobacterium sp. F49]